MTIDFRNGFTAIPNPILDELCRNKHIEAKARVLLAFLRIIVGYSQNRPNKSAAISYTALAKRTDASSRTIKRIVKQLESEEVIQVSRGVGRGNRNIYAVDFDGLDFVSKVKKSAKNSRTSRINTRTHRTMRTSKEAK